MILQRLAAVLHVAFSQKTNTLNLPYDMMPFSQPASTVPVDKNMIRVHLSADALEKVLDFLLQSHFPFEVDYRAPYHSTSSLPPQALAPSATERTEDAFVPMSIEKAFRTYIAEAPETVSPREEEMARAVGMSSVAFKEHFRKCYGKTIRQAHLACKMEKAAKWLKKGYRCTEVSRKLGYSEKSSIKFNKMFQKHFGITPKKYQLMHQDQ